MGQFNSFVEWKANQANSRRRREVRGATETDRLIALDSVRSSCQMKLSFVAEMTNVILKKTTTMPQLRTKHPFQCNK